MSQSEYLRALHNAWADFGDPRSIVGIDDTSPNVSTNTVFRLHLSDRSCVFAKVSNYGSYFLFAEDHDRLFRCTQLLKGTRFEDFLVPVLAKDNQPIVNRPTRGTTETYGWPFMARLPSVTCCLHNLTVNSPVV